MLVGIYEVNERRHFIGLWDSMADVKKELDGLFKIELDSNTNEACSERVAFDVYGATYIGPEEIPGNVNHDVAYFGFNIWDYQSMPPGMLAGFDED